MIEPVSLMTAVFLCTALAGWVLTIGVQRLSSGWNIVDHENHRSLHTGKVPRGGGAAIVIVVCLAQLVLISIGFGLHGVFIGYLGLALAAAALGLLDDVVSLPIVFRLVIQITIGAGFYLVGGTANVGNHILGLPLVIIAVVAAINISNFMDGSDGLLGTQALAVVSTVGAWCFLQEKTGASLYCASLAGAILGFVFMNWSPAKIFLGDVGSYFIGANFALFVFVINEKYLLPLLIILLPLGTDAVLTLARRTLRKQKFWLPHREHVYQRLVLKGVQPNRLSMGLLCIYLLIFMPLAIAAALYQTLAVKILILSVALSLSIWSFFYKYTERG